MVDEQNSSKIKYYLKEYIVDIIIVLVILTIFASIGYAFYSLPRTDNLENLQMVEATQVLDINGNLISKLFEENRTVVTISNISNNLINAIIANEDVRFYKHIGIDPIGILRAVIVNLKKGEVTEGGSTITQQLAKNMFLTQERTILRKIKEALLAILIERKFSKQEILQAYLNQVYFGEGSYGVEAASQVYFGKHAKDLSLAESALLAGLPRGPNIYSPYVDLNAALSRRAVVLNGMVKNGYITEEERDIANSEPIVLAGKKKRVVQASYFLDYVAQELVGKYGANRVYKGGLKVYTTLDIKHQQAAETVLKDYQGAVLVLDAKTGYIKAMVGGKNYQESQINRVVAEVRQPGSAFKPFVYTQALNDGLTAASVIIDEPINISGYKPQNYDKKYRGKITLKKGLRWSVNVAAVKLGQQIGMEKVLYLAKQAGITTLVEQDNNLAAALGGLTQGVSLIELTSAYTMFANDGIVSKPLAILKVFDENNIMLEENHPIQKPVIRADIAYLMTDLMKGALYDGTAVGANIGVPAAGKTGTTDNYETAWFIGYTPELVAGIYIGNDNRKPVGISGSEVATLWGGMMKNILEGKSKTDFTIPPNVITGIPICADSGKRALPGCPEIEYSAFIRGTEPKIFDNRIFQLTPPASEQESKSKESADTQPRIPKIKLPWFQLPAMY